MYQRSHITLTAHAPYHHTSTGLNSPSLICKVYGSIRLSRIPDTAIHPAFCSAVNNATRVSLRLRKLISMTVWWTVCMLTIVDNLAMKSIAIWGNIARPSHLEFLSVVDDSDTSRYFYDRTAVGDLMFCRKLDIQATFLKSSWVKLQILSHKWHDASLVSQL